MSSHVVRLRVISGPRASGQLVLSCSCDPDEDLLPLHQGPEITLAGLNDIAHEHIEAAERGEGYAAEPTTSTELTDADMTYYSD